MQIIKEGLVRQQRNNIFEGKVSLRIFLEIPIILPFGWTLPKSVLFRNQLLYLQLAWLSFKQSYQTCFLGGKKMPSYKQQLGLLPAWTRLSPTSLEYGAICKKELLHLFSRSICKWTPCVERDRKILMIFAHTIESYKNRVLLEHPKHEGASVIRRLT